MNLFLILIKLLYQIIIVVFNKSEIILNNNMVTFYGIFIFNC